MKKGAARGSTGSGNGKRAERSAARDARLPDLSQYGRLAEYNRKRHFGVTPEPPGTARARETRRPLEFVVQKHRASQLHYDSQWLLIKHRDDYTSGEDLT